MTDHLVKVILMLALFSIETLQATPVGEFEDHGDVGAPTLSGSATYDAENQEYMVAGAGTNMWFGGDQFHFLWKKMRGNFILRTRMQFIGKGAIDHRKAGWMVRGSLEPDAPYADCAEHGNGLTSLQFRRYKGANTEEIALPATNTDVLQFERRGADFIFSAARFGEPLITVTLKNFDLGDEVMAGLFVCSHSANVIERAIFRDVRIIIPTRPDFTPYRDYLGSVLEVLDVPNGRLKRIYSSEQPFEAPNWTKDGSALIYNVSGRAPGWGRLMRFDLATGRPALLDTGSATNNNNDHVLSFDGSMLGISDQAPSLGGQSCIFTLPSGGGTPKQITSRGPSYLHGWSPDGKWLVFTGGRNNKFDIYKISAGGGNEIRLTDSPGLNDGPEFSPDGNYIYFNSCRTSKMQIWRMRPDGTGQEPVTNDSFNNWFPHLSPDGKWIAFLSYTTDVPADQHPYYKQVYLRLLPVDGVNPRIVAYVYGGQGTMNVPSWSPDSKHIAFVSNTELP